MTIRYAAQAKPPRPILPYIAVVLLLAGAFVAGRELAPRAEPEAPSPTAFAGPQTVEPAAAGSQADLQAENRQLRERLNAALLENADGGKSLVADLEAENQALSERLAEKAEEAAMYKAGLEEAVAELNRLGAATRVPRPRPRSTSAPRPAKEYVFVRQPSVSVTWNAVSVTGTVHNAGSNDVAGYILLKLLEDGQVINTQRVYLEVPADTVETYDAEFVAETATTRQYRVSASWD